MHPLPAIINHGVPVALCSDDPSVFGNMGLTFDFFQVRHGVPLQMILVTDTDPGAEQVFVASEVNGLHTLRQLVWDSIRVRRGFSALSPVACRLPRCSFRAWTTTRRSARLECSSGAG